MISSCGHCSTSKRGVNQQGCWSLLSVSQSKRLLQIQVGIGYGQGRCLLWLLTLSLCPCGAAKSWCEGRLLLAALFFCQCLTAQSRLRYQKRYQDLLDALAEAYPGGSSPPRRSPQDALQCFPGIYELFAQYHFDPTSANLDLPVGSPSENALAWLLNMAIEHFGFVARDVFAAVFDFQAVELLHEDAFKVGFNNLADSVVDLVAGDRRHVNNTRHYIISMHPPDSSDIRNTSYQLRWKSDWVLMKVTKTLHLTKDTEIQQKISDFQGLLQSRDLAGIFIEELARRSEHRIL